MSQRGIQTKNEILKAAKKLFMKKGFVAVTMTDLCEATGLSRGGLYRHFSSTKEIFLALLNNDKDNWEEELQKAVSKDLSAIKMLAFYLEQVYREVVDGEGYFSLAIYEYWRTEQDEDGFLSKRYGSAVTMMEQLLLYGQSNGAFGVFDAHLEAEHMVIFIDGLKLSTVGLQLPPEIVRQQLDNLLNRIIQYD